MKCNVPDELMTQIIASIITETIIKVSTHTKKENGRIDSARKKENTILFLSLFIEVNFRFGNSMKKVNIWNIM